MHLFFHLLSAENNHFKNQRCENKLQESDISKCVYKMCPSNDLFSLNNIFRVSPLMRKLYHYLFVQFLKDLLKYFKKFSQGVQKKFLVVGMANHKQLTSNQPTNIIFFVYHYHHGCSHNTKLELTYLPLVKYYINIFYIFE